MTERSTFGKSRPSQIIAIANLSPERIAKGTEW